VIVLLIFEVIGMQDNVEPYEFRVRSEAVNKMTESEIFFEVIYELDFGVIGARYQNFMSY
jgi:hypothetical protein